MTPEIEMLEAALEAQLGGVEETAKYYTKYGKYPSHVIYDNARAHLVYLREVKPLVDNLEGALEVTIEHLEGENESLVAISLKQFNDLYDAATDVYEKFCDLTEIAGKS